jgi:hypothetical protein
LHSKYRPEEWRVLMREEKEGLPLPLWYLPEAWEQKRLKCQRVGALENRLEEEELLHLPSALHRDRERGSPLLQDCLREAGPSPHPQRLDYQVNPNQMMVTKSTIGVPVLP